MAKFNLDQLPALHKALLEGLDFIESAKQNSLPVKKNFNHPTQSEFLLIYLYFILCFIIILFRVGLFYVPRNKRVL
jgi:hypothetical protein